MTNQQRIADLIKKVHLTEGADRAAYCGYDCMLQWEKGLLDDTIAAWERSVEETKRGEGHTDTNRNGIWAPAIAL